MGKISNFNLPAGGEKGPFFRTPKKRQLYLPKIIGKNKIREGGRGTVESTCRELGPEFIATVPFGTKKTVGKKLSLPVFISFFFGGGSSVVSPEKKRKNFSFFREQTTKKLFASVFFPSFL